MSAPTREQVVQWADVVDWGLYSPVTYTKLTEFSILARADLEATVKEQAAEISELKRWRTSGIERSAKDSDIVSLYRQQLAAAQLHIEQLLGAMLMMLCDSEGKCFMAGSVKDRFIIDTALSTQPDRSALEAERQRVAEACAKVCENDESGRDSGGYFADTIRAGQWREHLK